MPPAASNRCAATQTQFRRRTRWRAIKSPGAWAARKPTRTSRSAAPPAVSAWPAIWFPTTWASIPTGCTNTPIGSSVWTTAHSQATHSTARTCRSARASRLTWKTTTIPAQTQPWCLNATITAAVKRATFTMATMAPACPGMTRRN